MDFEIDIIKGLQSLSNGFTDALNQFFSFFGTEIFFLICACLLYWCIDKKFAHRFFNVFILGAAVTSFFKAGFKRVRPFNAHPQEIRSIGAPEQSYCFPSGHSESVAVVATSATIKYGKKYRFVPYVGVMLTLLVMVSRMFLGQHYLSDVLTGMLSGVFYAIAFNFIMSLFKDKEEWFVVTAAVISVVAISVFAGLNKLGDNPDLLKGMGAFLAFDVGYFVEKRFVKYDVAKNNKWWQYALRILLGGAIVLGLEFGLKAIIPKDIPMLYCFFRYALMGLWASLCPALFKLLKI